MSSPDAVEAVSRLIAAYPQATISPATVASYAEHLSDVPPELLARTVTSVIQTARFFPTIAELRERAARLAGLLPVTSAEALAVVRRADVERPVCRRDGSLAYVEREWNWPEDLDETTLDAIRDTLERVGEPVNRDGAPHFGWETGFGATYGTLAESVTRRVLADLPRALAVHRRPALSPPPEASEGGT